MKQRPHRLLTKNQVADKLGLFNRQGELNPGAVDDLLYRDPNFPKAVKWGGHNRWLEHVVDAYVESLPGRKIHPRKTKAGAR